MICLRDKIMDKIPNFDGFRGCNPTLLHRENWNFERFPVPNFTLIGVTCQPIFGPLSKRNISVLVKRAKTRINEPPTITFLANTFWLNVLILKMYEINTLSLLPLKIYLIILKHIKSLIFLNKLVFISNFTVFILMFVICFLF